MEALTRLVSESFARHGFDRPLDYRRLQWSRWFHCESPHSLLLVPSKPGVFALAEEIARVETSASSIPRMLGEGKGCIPESRRMLAVAKFFEADDMAFVLDRMMSHQNPMRVRLASGHYFVRFVVIDDEAQRLSICNALNQWILNSTEKTTGIGSHFATSLELTAQPEDGRDVARHNPSLSSERGQAGLAVKKAWPDARIPEENQAVRPVQLSEPPFVIQPTPAAATTPLHSGVASNIHCPFPSGF